MFQQKVFLLLLLLSCCLSTKNPTIPYINTKHQKTIISSPQGGRSGTDGTANPLSSINLPKLVNIINSLPFCLYSNVINPPLDLCQS